MPPKKDIQEELLAALQSDTLVVAIGKIFELKLNDKLNNVEELKEETQSLKQKDIMTANAKINMLEAYTRRDNLNVSGLTTSSWADAASTVSIAIDTNSDQMTSSEDVEKAVLIRL